MIHQESLLPAELRAEKGGSGTTSAPGRRSPVTACAVTRGRRTHRWTLFRWSIDRRTLTLGGTIFRSGNQDSNTTTKPRNRQGL